MHIDFKVQSFWTFAMHKITFYKGKTKYSWKWAQNWKSISFKTNFASRRQHHAKWHRNVILKSHSFCLSFCAISYKCKIHIFICHPGFSNPSSLLLSQSFPHPAENCHRAFTLRSGITERHNNNINLAPQKQKIFFNFLPCWIKLTQRDGRKKS